jgi:hypothetical protein
MSVSATLALVALAHSSRPHAALQVRAGARFGQAQAAKFAFAGGQARQPRLLKLLRAEVDQRPLAQAVVRRNRQRRRAAGPAKFFDGDGGADSVEVGAAVDFGHLQPQHAQRPHFAHRLPVELARFVHMPG